VSAAFESSAIPKVAQKSALLLVILKPASASLSRAAGQRRARRQAEEDERVSYFPGRQRGMRMASAHAVSERGPKPRRSRLRRFLRSCADAR
jgi:hypothetical protein